MLNPPIPSIVKKPSATDTVTVADLNFTDEVGTKPDMTLTPSIFIECLLSVWVASHTETVTS